jgi:hypothetical protein
MNSRPPRLTRFPRPASIEDYEAAEAELDAKLQELPCVVAVYRTGTIGVPGISDIDRVAVVEGDVRLPTVWDELRPRTRYLAMHSPFVVDFDTFVRHRWFASFEPLEIVWGRRIVVDEPPTPEERDELLGAEGLVVAWLKLIRQTTIGRTKVRPLLCELNNVRRDLRLARLTRDDAPSAWQLVSDVTRAREEWWSLTQPERFEAVREIEAQAPRAVHNALGAIASRFRGAPACEEIRLCGAWSSVTLRGDRRVAQDDSFYIVPYLIARASTKVAEARWRFAQHRIGVPSPIVSLLSGALGSGSFRAQRRDLVRHYAVFMREKAPAYSSVGHVGIFPG